MTRKRFRQACGIIAALGFLLVLGTAGASDCDLIPMSQILRQGCIGLGMLAGGYGWEGISHDCEERPEAPAARQDRKSPR